MLLVHLCGNVGSGSLSIYALFRDDLLECDDPADSLEQCRKRNIMIQAVMTTFFVLMWLFQFCAQRLSCLLLPLISLLSHRWRGPYRKLC